jgi:hypothetical protein
VPELCCRQIGPRTAPGEFSAAALATDVVLKTVAVFGSVNANQRHYYRAAKALASAERSWLEQFVTRRVPRRPRRRCSGAPMTSRSS